MKLRQTVSALVTVLCGNGWLKMLGLYHLGQNCLHLTFEQYLRSETYSRKNEKLPNIVILACKNKGGEQEKSRDRNYKRTQRFQGRIAGNKVMF